MSETPAHPAAPPATTDAFECSFWSKRLQVVVTTFDVVLTNPLGLIHVLAIGVRVIFVQLFCGLCGLD
ncbi:hypothetical protein B0H11DRAFT_2239550 [Mycena galericulata]|nr:hypothetical protein B0H11DRAFT_2239550 [Mycena galericulata]